MITCKRCICTLKRFKVSTLTEVHYLKDATQICVASLTLKCADHELYKTTLGVGHTPGSSHTVLNLNMWAKGITRTVKVFDYVTNVQKNANVQLHPANLKRTSTCIMPQPLPLCH